MKVRVLKGTNQIGGCITEIMSDKGTKIIIDFGEDLPDDNVITKKENPNIPGLTTGSKKYDAVFITHSHGDHIGLINYILDDIPVYVEPESKEIYKLLSVFTYKQIRFDTKDMLYQIPIIINNDITVTPYYVDHSAYHSAMLLIEADGKRILHTGDFRSNGLTGQEFEPTLKSIGHVDFIITEGTCLSRVNEENETEEHLMQRVEEVFKKYDQVFVLQSSTNIDRIKTFYNVSKKTNKTFIEDIFTSNITDSIHDDSIPSPLNRKDVYTWVTSKYRKNKNLKFKRKYVYPFLHRSKQKAYLNKKYCFMVKASMEEAIQKLYEKGFIDNACLVYSMWEGYRDKKDIKNFIERIQKYGVIDVGTYHTSGHADRKTIELLNGLNASKVIPIHTTEPEKLKEVLNHVIVVKDNEIIEV